MCMLSRFVRCRSMVLLGVAALVAGAAIGCDSGPNSGKTVTESPVMQKEREDTIKDAMKRGAYGDQYKEKPAPAKK
jgi:hypothetical protein